MAYSTITKPSLHFNTKLFTGTGSAQSITGVGFQPDWVWSKGRNSTNNHTSFDAVRGTGKALYQNLTNAEENQAQGITAFGTDGFSVGTLADINNSGGNIVSWNWKANGQGSANTDGNINSTVSLNSTAGFSIVKWTGNNSGSANVGHGLGAIPDVIIVKNMEQNTSWGVKHSSMSSGHMCNLNTTDASSDRNGSTNGGLSNLGSTTTFGFNAGSGGTPEVNGSGNNMIAYCFTEKKGYSKFGKYTGNGNADGTFVYTGFKPAFIMIKDKDYAEAWMMYDNKRPGYNLNANHLMADSNTTETNSSANTMDILSNGFKMRATNNAINRNDHAGFLYMAFAAEPLVANVGQSIPATAR